MPMTDFCFGVVWEVLTRSGHPEIFHTDHNHQFTSLEFTGLLRDWGPRISTDGFLWRSPKHEQIHLRAYETIRHPQQRLNRDVQFYNQLVSCSP